MPSLVQNGRSVVPSANTVFISCLEPACMVKPPVFRPSLHAGVNERSQGYKPTLPTITLERISQPSIIRWHKLEGEILGPL